METLIDRKTLETEWGMIDYSYSPPDNKYSSGLLLFLGSYIKKEFRRPWKDCGMAKC